MKIKRNHKLIWLSILFSGVLLTAGSPLLAQDSQQAAAQPDDQTPPPNQAQASAAGEKCWQQASLTKEEIKQRRSIMENAKSQIAQIDQNSALTPQQQRQQIRELRRNTREQLDKILTPEQRQALRQCQQERREDHSGGSGATATTPQN